MLREVHKMPDYRKLYYSSQAQLAEAIETLENLKQKLILFTQECERKVIETDDNDKSGTITMTTQKD